MGKYDIIIGVVERIGLMVGYLNHEWSNWVIMLKVFDNVRQVLQCKSFKLLT